MIIVFLTVIEDNKAMETPDDFRLLVKLAVEVHRVEDLLTPSGGTSPITPLQHAALRILFFEGEMSLGRLARCLGVSLPNGSREVKHLTAQGLAVKIQDTQDRRLVRINLTAAGRDVVESTFRVMEEAFRGLTRNWTSEMHQETAARLSGALDMLVKIKDEP